MAPFPVAPLRASSVLAGALVAGLALLAPGHAQEAAPTAPAAQAPAAAEDDDEALPAADSPECQWAGERILSLLWRDDIRTASDFLDLYDRFECPTERVARSFRCLVKIGVSPDQGDPGLPRRAKACWADPNLDPASLKAEAATPAGQPPKEGEAPAATQGGDATSQPDGQKPAEGAPQPQ